jgi:hypothetical protein
MNNSDQQPQVVAFLSDVMEVRTLIESSCGMTLDELEELARDSERLTQAYALFVRQSAEKYGIDLEGMGCVPTPFAE